MRILLPAIGAVALSGAGLAQSVVLSDDFETDSAANYILVDDGTPDGTQTFAFDYLAAGIPLAPRSAPGDAGGLKLTVNDTAGSSDAWTVYHSTPVAADRYKLTVDVWMNFEGTSGTTEYAQVGVAGDGVSSNSILSPVSGSGAYLAFTGDGGSVTDYSWFRDCNNASPTDPECNTMPSSHPSYLGRGANASGNFFQGLFPAPPSTISGSPGNIWTTLEIEVDNFASVISFSFDGQLTYQGEYSSTLDGLVSLGLFDRFGSLSGPTNFALYDNLVVETLLTPLGTNYCVAAVNSTGSTGAISALGSGTAADNNVILTSSSLPSNAFGFFLTSMTQGATQNPGGSAGNLCLGGAIGRYVGPGQIQNSGSAGEFSLPLDLTATPQPTGLISVQAGETWNFTCWHRDAVGGTTTSNFTDGLEVRFL
ncbi:MAG: hypothetical protein P8R46_03385 [Planctomycetota bacterium]|nr:hypothetical protein [Planctomycetota bacterium]